LKRASVSHVERQNGTFRQWYTRLTLLTYAFSKGRDNLKVALALNFALFNFAGFMEVAGDACDGSRYCEPCLESSATFGNGLIRQVGNVTGASIGTDTMLRGSCLNRREKFTIVIPTIALVSGFRRTTTPSPISSPTASCGGPIEQYSTSAG
jgi:hypothetical protein